MEFTNLAVLIFSKSYINITIVYMILLLTLLNSFTFIKYANSQPARGIQEWCTIPANSLSSHCNQSSFTKCPTSDAWGSTVVQKHYINYYFFLNILNMKSI